MAPHMEFFMVYQRFTKLGVSFVSSTNTYNYNLASYLVSVLQPISTNCFSVKDSFSFADCANQHTHNGKFVCSFGVTIY